MNTKYRLTVDVLVKVAEDKVTITNTSKLLDKHWPIIERYLNQYRKARI